KTGLPALLRASTGACCSVSARKRRAPPRSCAIRQPALFRAIPILAARNSSCSTEVFRTNTAAIRLAPIFANLRGLRIYPPRRTDARSSFAFGNFVRMIEPKPSANPAKESKFLPELAQQLQHFCSMTDMGKCDLKIGGRKATSRLKTPEVWSFSFLAGA